MEESMEAVRVAQMSLEELARERERGLAVSRREPYFGRIDFAEAGKEAEQLYVGKRGVWVGDRPEVIDWRAPVASLFYNSSPGTEAEYAAPGGLIRGQLSLKRNLAVKSGALQRIVDARSSEDTGGDAERVDEFLAYRLWESRDARLRDIVSSIQAEQNAIIRAERDRPVIVQGVAGSGKTTVALHRLAYLLYRYRETMAAHRVVIFAPNNMFLDYIADVLPELGVGGVQQTTFADWALDQLDDAVKLADPAPRLAAMFAPGSEADPDQRIRFKGSLAFQDFLDQYCQAYEAAYVPDADLDLWPGARMPASQMDTWFHRQYSGMPLHSRRERILSRLKGWAEQHYDRYQNTSQFAQRRKTAQAALRKYAGLWPNHTPLELYLQALGTAGRRPARRGALLTAPPAPLVVDKAQAALYGQGRIQPEDLAPLAYLRSRLWGVRDNPVLDHVVIDEAQDFSPFQIALLRQLVPSDSFTILGDLSQGIHDYQGVRSWQELMAVFPPESCLYHQLDQSYRSTYEIMTFANSVLQHFDTGAPLARPVFRSGAPVRREPVPELTATLAATVRDLLARSHASIAVVGRTADECASLAAGLAAAGLQPNLLDPGKDTYRGGLSVIPAYLTKGLEFDAVVIADAGAHNYPATPRDAKLLYVALTRALHELWIFYTDTPSPLLPAP